MNRNDTIQQLRSLNPIPSDPPVPPVETLIGKLDLSVRALDDIFTINPPGPAHRSIVPRVAAGAAVATAAAVLVFTLTGGPGGHGRCATR